VALFKCGAVYSNGGNKNGEKLVWHFVDFGLINIEGDKETRHSCFLSVAYLKIDDYRQLLE